MEQLPLILMGNPMYLSLLIRVLTTLFEGLVLVYGFAAAKEP